MAFDGLPFGPVLATDKDGKPYELTAADMAGGMFAKRASGGFMGESVTVTMRIPDTLGVFIDVVVARSGESRNSVLNSVLEAGIEAAWLKLTDAEREEIRSEFFVSLNKYMENYKKNKKGGK